MWFLPGFSFRKIFKLIILIECVANVVELELKQGQYAIMRKKNGLKNKTFIKCAICKACSNMLVQHHPTLFDAASWPRFNAICWIMLP